MKQKRVHSRKKRDSSEIRTTVSFDEFRSNDRIFPNNVQVTFFRRLEIVFEEGCIYRSIINILFSLTDGEQLGIGKSFTLRNLSVNF